MHCIGCVKRGCDVAMRARDQSSIFSTGGKFRPDYGLLLELHALTLVARSYALLQTIMNQLNSTVGLTSRRLRENTWYKNSNRLNYMSQTKHPGLNGGLLLLWCDI